MLKLVNTFWTRLKGFFQSPQNKTEAPIKPAPEKTPTVPAHSGPKPPGLDCPECGFRIIISVPMLLSGEAIICQACHLKLSVEREQSKPCLDELRKVYDAVQKVDEVKHQKR